MPKLKYKEHKKKKEKSRDRTSSKREKPYKPPTLYEEEEGWVPPHHDNDVAWRQHLFEAMIEDEGQDPFYSGYEHVQPTPVMTDEEYRQHIVNGMYQRTHAEEIAAEEKKRKHKEKKRQERQEEKIRMENKEKERIRVQNVYKQLQDLQAFEIYRKEYNEKWNALEKNNEIHRKDIPWPIMKRGEFNFESVKSFMMMNTSKLTTSEIKMIVRKEQTRYHPDKFTRYIKKFKGSDKEKEKTIKQVNEISGWLNELWTQINNI